jgi:hypothetical protein
MKGKGRTWGKFDKTTRQRHSREDRQSAKQIAESNLEIRSSFGNLVRIIPGCLGAIAILAVVFGGIGFGIYKLYQWCCQ